VSFYLDASVIVPMLTNQSMSSVARAFLEGASAPFWVSDFAEAEVASAVSRLVRTGVLTADSGGELLAGFDDWLFEEATLVEMERTDLRSAIALVRRFDLMLRTPDALHLVISERLSAELVTFDRRLALAAQAIQLPVRTP
jgi:uncharacterized protein